MQVISETDFIFFVDIQTSKLNPPSRQAKVGDSVEFLCNIMGNVKVSWTFNEARLPKNTETGKAGVNKFYMRIVEVQTSNAGIYTCSGLDNNIKIMSTGELVVIGKFSQMSQYNFFVIFLL